MPQHKCAATRELARELELLRADVRYRRERRDLYRARLYAGRGATRTRLEELSRLYEYAEARLGHLEQEIQRKRDQNEQAESL